MIRYTFTFDPDTVLTFEVDENGDSSEEPTGSSVPEWVKLERSQCGHCSLPPGSRKTCPAALSIRPVVEAFTSRISYESVHVKVELGELKIESDMATQHAVGSLLGLLLALSSCPVLSKLRPMARIHLPFGGDEHTLFRFVGMYLIAQRLRSMEGLTPDWEMSGLLELVDLVHETNRQLAERIQLASKEDATANSLVILDTLAYAVEINIQKGLEGFRPHFSRYLDNTKEQE